MGHHHAPVRPPAVRSGQPRRLALLLRAGGCPGLHRRQPPLRHPLRSLRNLQRHRPHNCCRQEERGQGQGQGQGKGEGKCPTIADIEAWVYDDISDKLCVFSALGWLDQEMNLNNETYQADIASLPTAVSAQLQDELLIQCAYDAIAPTQSSAWAAVADVKTYEKCYKKWSDDDKAKFY